MPRIIESLIQDIVDFRKLTKECTIKIKQSFNQKVKQGPKVINLVLRKIYFLCLDSKI